MFGRKKAEPPKKRNRDLSQFGLIDISDDFDPTKEFGNGDEDDADSDLEAELAAITSDGKTNDESKSKRREKKLIPPSDLDKMIAESLKDIDSDEEVSSVDENDPNLLGELQDLTGEAVEEEESSSVVETKEEPQVFLPTTTTNVIDIIKNRIKMYELAEKNAKVAGESSRARRFNRGLNTLKDLLKQASGGKNINVDDIPPEVSVGKSVESKDEGTLNETNDSKSPEVSKTPSPPISEPAPASELKPSPTTEEINSPNHKEPPVTSPSDSTEKDSKLSILNARKNEYKLAALEAKRSGDKESALQFVKVIKQFDTVIKAAENGEEVDLSDMPPPPNEFNEFLKQMLAQAGETAPAEPTPVPESASISTPEQTKEPEPIPHAPKTIMEGLQQRLEKYKSIETAAKSEGNSSKARRYGRIVKQYEDAIKLHRAGKSVAFDELPTPPGFAALPIEGGSSVGSSVPSPTSPTAKKNSENTKSDANESPADTTEHTNSPPKRPLRKHESTTRIFGNQEPTNLVEKQMETLLQRQKEFKIAAVEAKKAGEIEQAKEYLRIYKGFEALLNATSSGFPVDLSTLPIPPSERSNLEDSFAIVSETDCDPNDDLSDIHVRVEEQLAKQLMMCKNTRDHHKAMGDVAGMNRFENLALSVQKDLDLVRYARKKKVAIPKFHYEQKSFNIVHCNTDLNDNELEINVIRGITYNVPNPKDVDTYVKIEFPYPPDDFFRTKTPLVKNTDSPDYDQKYKIEIQRTNRQCQRIFKRQSVKFEIYSRGCCLGGICRKFPMCCFSGFLRSDVLIGTVSVKLQPLETKCDIHDSFDLMNGRKPVGGKLEVKIRIRNPILTKQIEHLNEKWLVLDS